MKVSLTLGRYMAIRYGVLFALTTLAFLSIVFVGDWLELVRKSVSFSNVSLAVSAEMALSRLPLFFQKLLPFTALIAALWCYSHFSRTRELVVARSMGLSPLALLLPVAAVSFLVGIITVAVLSPLTAASLRHFNNLDNRYFRGVDSDIALSPAGFWLRENRDEDNVIIHARQLDATRNILKDVSLIFFDKDDQFSERWDASFANITAENTIEAKTWTLHNVLVTSLSSQGDSSLVSQRHDRLVYQASLGFDKIQDNFTPPEAVSVWSLPAFTRLMEETGFSPRRHLMYYYFLLFLPFFIAVMGFFAAVFALRLPLRGRGVMIRLVALVLGFVMFVFSEFLYARGEAEQLPFFVAAFAPVLLVSVSGGFILLHYEG